MSIDQPSSATPLAERQPQTLEEQWIATHVEGAESRQSCLRCGNHVSVEFVRTLGAPDGRVHACPRCTAQGELLRGAASDPNHEPHRSMDSHCRDGHRSIEEARR